MRLFRQRRRRGRRSEAPKTFDLRGFPWNTHRPLWHGTTGLRAIVEDGFKTRDQLEGSPHATGGGPSDAVSLTADRRIATAIIVGLDTGRRIALNPDGAYWLERMFRGIPLRGRNKLWNRAVDYWTKAWDASDVEQLARNRIVENERSPFGRPRSELPPGAVPIRQSDCRGIVYSWSRPGTEEERATLVWKLYTTVVALSERTFYDPMFWLTDPGWLASLDPADLGLLLVESRVPYVCTEPFSAVNLGYMDKPSEYMTHWLCECRWQVMGDFAKGREAAPPTYGARRFGDYEVDYDSPIRRVSPSTSMIGVNGLVALRVYDPSLIDITSWWTLDELRMEGLAPKGIYYPWFREGS